MNHGSMISKPKVAFKDYLPLVYIFIFIIAATWVELNYFTKDYRMLSMMRIFMAFFFLTFGFFKVITWKNFAMAYQDYDILAKRSVAYAYIYPVIELSLGASYLLNYIPLLTNSITVVLMGIGSIGIAQNLLSPNRIHCACLGTLIKVPLSKVSLTEDLLMGIMALVSIFFILNVF